MSTATEEPKVEQSKTGELLPAVARVPVTYGIQDAAIAQLKKEYTGLTADTPAGYEKVRLAIAHIRGLRTQIKKRHKELKADSLEYGRMVDKEANRITAMLESIENPLIESKSAIDDEKERKRLAKEAEERARVEAAEKARKDAEDARIAAVRAAEQKRIDEERAALEAEKKALAAERAEELARQKVEQDRIAAEQKAERERLAAEQRRIDEANRIERENLEAHKRASQKILDDARAADEQKRKADQDKLDAERRANEAERLRLERIEFERQAKIKAEQEALLRVQNERIAAELEAAEQKRLAEIEREKQEAEKARIEALKPDIEKAVMFAVAIRESIMGLRAPKMATEAGTKHIQCVIRELGEVADGCEAFDGGKESVL